jgi:hypothetical protein
VLDFAALFLIGFLAGWRARDAWGWYKVKRMWARVMEDQERRRRDEAREMCAPSSPPRNSTGNGWSRNDEGHGRGG